MKTARIVALILLLAIGMAFMSSCGLLARKKYSDYAFDYFDTVTSILGYEANKSEFDKNAEKIKSALGEYHRLYDIYNTYDGITNLASINTLRGSAESPLKVDTRIIELLQYSKEMYDKTNGYMNIAMGGVLRLWHECRSNGLSDITAARLPDKDELEAAAKDTNINDIVIDEAASTVYLASPRVYIDVGAIAKGYAVERVAEELERAGKSGYVINVGGNVRTVGAQADGAKWEVAIENPDRADKENSLIEALGLAGEAVVTSGVYQRFYMVEGKSYHHIIDPDTLYPAEGYLSVTVISRDSALADALSTALMCMETEQGRAITEAFSNVQVMWVFADSSRVYTDGFKSFRTASS